MATKGQTGHCPSGDLPQTSRHVHFYVTDVAAATGNSDRGLPQGLAAQEEVGRNSDALDLKVKGAL